MALIFQCKKKGNVILDAIMILVVLFAFGLLGIIGYKVINDVNTDIQADDDINNQSKTTMQDVTNTYPNLMDGAFVFAFALLWILGIVASFFIDTHPIFFGITIILMAFILFIGSSIDNVYAEFIEDEEFSAAAASFPKTTWIMDHLVIIILCISITIAIAIYGKNKYGS